MDHQSQSQFRECQSSPPPWFSGSNGFSKYFFQIFLLFHQIFLPSWMPGCRRNLDSVWMNVYQKTLTLLPSNNYTWSLKWWNLKGYARQSPDFYGILASRMVGRFVGKVGRIRWNPNIMPENSYEIRILTRFDWETVNRALY